MTPEFRKEMERRVREEPSNWTSDEAWREFGREDLIERRVCDICGEPWSTQITPYLKNGRPGSPKTYCSRHAPVPIPAATWHDVAEAWHDAAEAWRQAADAWDSVARSIWPFGRRR